MSDNKGSYEIQTLSENLQKARDEISKVVVGQTAVVESVLLAMLCDGHVLLEGAPGLAKTLLVRAIGKVFGMEFKRAQFTPDMMPSDLTGAAIYQPSEGEFKFTQGPILQICYWQMRSTEHHLKHRLLCLKRCRKNKYLLIPMYINSQNHF